MAGRSSSSNLDALTFQRLHPRAYLERFIAEGIRPDGREPATWRASSVIAGSISTANGSALVRLGETTVVCGVKAEIAEPDLERPEHGFVVPNVDLPAMCSPKFKPGPPGEEAQVLSERLNSVLTSVDVIPTTSLCIAPGKSAWVLYLDVICINYDGNVFDAALLAVIAALKNTRLPKATFNEDTDATTCSSEETQPLDIRSIPLSATFGIFDSKHILYDPTSFEEPLLETAITVVVDQDSKVISASQLGLGTRTSPDVLTNCITLAKQRRIELDQILTKE